jgi:hypothetical protein
MGRSGPHDAAWWQAKANEEISERNLSLATLESWTRQEAIGLDREIRADGQQRGLEAGS